MAKTMYDPWSKITTRNGYAGDEVISALQKSIRRGLEEQACMFAYELYISSPQLEEKLWRRSPLHRTPFVAIHGENKKSV